MPSRAVYLSLPAIAFLALAGCSGAKTVAFRDQGLKFRYPAGWSVTGFSRTVWPARLVVASYKVTHREVEGDCGGMRALSALPRNGGAVLLIDYGAAAGSGGFAPRPERFRIRQFARANYECFGESYMLRFEAVGHDLQAHLKLGVDASAATRERALLILDSLDRASN